MNTENFDNKINSLLKKYVFSEDISPEAKAIADKIEADKRKKANDPKEKEATGKKVQAMLNGETESSKTQTNKLSS
jgi:hypothetical protein